MMGVGELGTDCSFPVHWWEWAGERLRGEQRMGWLRGPGEKAG